MKTVTNIFLTSALLLCLSGLCFASDNEMVSKEEFNKIINELKEKHAAEINKLSRDNAEIKKVNKELSNRIRNLETKEKAGPATDVAELKEDVEMLSELLDLVEKKTLLDKVKIGVEMRTRADWFDFHETRSVKNIFGRTRYRSQHEEEIHGLISNRLRMNLTTDLTHNLKFRARLVMYKNWNDDDAAGSFGQGWFTPSRAPDDTDIEVERAYVDYFFKLHEKLPMAFTFGRLPTTDGLPTDLRENTPRKSAYPDLAFDVEVDGIALSADLENLTGLPESALRFFYVRAISDNEMSLFRKPEVDFGDFEIFVSQFETGIPRLPNSLFITNFLYIPDIRSIDLRVRGLKPLKLPEDLGSLWKLTFLFESKRFLGSWFDIFAGYSYMETEADNLAVWGLGVIPVMRLGVLNTGTTSDRSAFAYHLGFRINLPFKSLNKPKFGVEFNRGTKYWVALNPASEDPLHKLDVRGHVWDFYYIQPINRHFMLRLGYTYIDLDHDGKLVYGDPGNIDQTVKNMYFLLDAKF